MNLFFKRFVIIILILILITLISGRFHLNYFYNIANSDNLKSAFKGVKLEKL